MCIKQSGVFTVCWWGCQTVALREPPTQSGLQGTRRKVGPKLGEETRPGSPQGPPASLWTSAHDHPGGGAQVPSGGGGEDG